MTDPALPFTEDLDAGGHAEPSPVPRVFHAPRSSIGSVSPASKEDAYGLVARGGLGVMMAALAAHGVRVARLDAAGVVTLDPDVGEPEITVSRYALVDDRQEQGASPAVVYGRTTDDLCGHLRQLLPDLSRLVRGGGLVTLEIDVVAGRCLGTMTDGGSVDLVAALERPAGEGSDR